MTIIDTPSFEIVSLLFGDTEYTPEDQYGAHSPDDTDGYLGEYIPDSGSGAGDELTAIRVDSSSIMWDLIVTATFKFKLKAKFGSPPVVFIRGGSINSPLPTTFQDIWEHAYNLAAVDIDISTDVNSASVDATVEIDITSIIDDVKGDTPDSFLFFITPGDLDDPDNEGMHFDTPVLEIERNEGGYLHKTMSPFTFNITGESPVLASVVKTLDPFGLVATGQLINEGSLVKTLDPFGLIARGQPDEEEGTVIKELDPFGLVFRGAKAVDGSLTKTLSPFTLKLQGGIHPNTGSVVASLNAFSLHLTNQPPNPEEVPPYTESPFLDATDTVFIGAKANVFAIFGSPT